ncbi:MAG TPA: alpha-hydroxy acid oxidase [Terriglobales bacterium]|jgi:isopentenyl diphosphate isomerase/L-lactate dehydrogenase-like FMN-dependent dehydrogenase|nr:alpha-hydroxy acid oxidase [Terriglobales bacterium]
MTVDFQPINLFDFEAIAKERLPKEEYDYIAGGATDEISVDRNRRAYASWALRPRVLRDVSALDLATTVFGSKINMPVMIAPCGGHKRAHPEGEIATFRAATACNTVLTVSANSNTSFEDLARAAKGHLWVQLYPFRDKAMTEGWLQRAKDAGYKAVVVTLDSQWPPKRERNIRNNYRRTRGVNYPGISTATPRPADRAGEGSDPGATWKDLEWIKAASDLPVVAKGIMTGEDVELCAEAGADGVIVSNHGGRHLDNTLATVEVLEEAVAAAKGKLEVFLDGGIRRGADVVKAIALGAKAVFIGRPLFWGLAVDGEKGVVRVLDILREEIEITMAKCGRPTIASIDSTVVVKAPPL